MKVAIVMILENITKEEALNRLEKVDCSVRKALDQRVMVSLDRAKKYIQKCVDDEKIPGATFAYVTKDSFITDFVGYKQLLPSRITLEEGTMYDMASCTKVVCTTTLVLKLIEEGCFNLKQK